MRLTSEQNAAYLRLIDRCADHIGETMCGRPGVEQLPQLTPAEIALVIRSDESEVQDHLRDMLSLSACAADIEMRDFCNLGVRLAMLLERACREAVAYDVMCVIEERRAESEEAV